MYGTIYRIRPKAGKEQEVVAIMEEWERERASKVSGYKASYLYKLDNGGMMGAAVFESKHDYFANADDPAQDEWYKRFRDLLEDDPEWNDGEIVRSWGSSSQTGTGTSQASPTPTEDRPRPTGTADEETAG